MSEFGWSYPPGCSGPPDDEKPISELEEAVLVLLEDAGIPTEVNDQIMKLIQDAEYKLYHRDAEGDPSDEKPPEPNPELE